MDLKAPGSGEAERNLLANIPLLTARDEVKIVIADRADYEWARSMISGHLLQAGMPRCPVLLSPVQGELAPVDLAGWILEDRLPVRFQLQLHKVLWGNMQGK